jgi:hypothetical protein
MKEKAFEQFDFKDGKITYDEFHIDFSRPLSEQLYFLKEDLLQVEYMINEDNYILDVGWYSEMDPNGTFKIRVIKNFNWLNPLYLKKCKKEKDFFDSLKNAIEVIQKNKVGY